MVDPGRVRELLAIETLRFCDGDGLEPVRQALQAGPGADDIAVLRALLPRSGAPALFAAIALATVGDDSGLAVLRRPHDHHMTSSCFELGLALCARLALGDVEAPLSFLNASMLGPLALAVGAYPPSTK